MLEISKDGTDWIDVGKISGGTAQVDIGPFVEANEPYYYVKLTDLNTKSEIPGADIDAIGAIGSAIRLNLNAAVLFDFGKSELKSEGLTLIKELTNQIASFEKARITIEGHTDNVGDDQSNLNLSLQRAKGVAAVLSKNLDSNQFTFREIGQGEKKPLVSNDTVENRSKNRRVEILVIPN